MTWWCEGKQQFADRQAALGAIARQARRAKQRSATKDRKKLVGKITPYRCSVCGHWHVGGNNS